MIKKKSLFSLLLQFKYSFLLGILALTCVDLAQLAIPKLVEWIIDSLTVTGPSFAVIRKYSLYILALGIYMAFFRLGWRYFIMGAARKIENSIRNEFFEHIQKLHFDFFSSRKVGDLMAHTVNDIETLKFSCGLGILIAYDGIFLFFFILIAMLFISPALTLYAFIPFPILGYFMYKFGNKIEKRFQRSQDSFSNLTESARQSVSGIKVVKAFNREEFETKDFEMASLAYLDKNIKLVNVWGVYQPAITFMAATATVIFLFFGGISAINSEITLGKFTAMLVYLVMLTWPMMAMGWSVDIMKRGNASINRLNEIFSIEYFEEPDNDKFDRPLKGDINFKNVSFSYNAVPALDNINLEIPKGISLGITGTTASGKTTLINLLMRIYEVREGEILIDGINLNQIKKERLQEAIVFVPQETTIFSGTIFDNITFMNPNLTEHEVTQAAKNASIYEEIIDFPDGFKTMVGERGLSLSGGQRQRIAVARAMLLNPEVLILDDVLSSLDLQTENTVLKNINKLMKGKTVIAVSSRSPSISWFDQIAVFENGRIIEIGNHRELINSEGIYSSLYKVQTI
ncbi:MAG: ABC transporter ATP-binding protein [Thermodesulfobacteriota bacterium]